MEKFITKRVQELLTERAMSVSQLAKASGIAPVTFYRCLADNTWKIAYVEKIATALNVPPCVLVCDSEENSKIIELETRIATLQAFIKSELGRM
jgi:predicted transcriptional regulator